MTAQRSDPTQKHKDPTVQPKSSGRPVLLAAFPRQVSLPWPPSGTTVGYDWLAKAGIPDEEVSRQHLRFHGTPGRIDVEDLKSTNGTFVNREKLEPEKPRLLKDGDVIRFGTTIAVYRKAFAGPDERQEPLGRLIGPWGLSDLRSAVNELRGQRPRNVLILGDGGRLLGEEIARALGRGTSRFGEIDVVDAKDRIEDELFGCEKGAFTGSRAAHPGLIRRCHGGVVFLDEISELPMGLQPRLLRFLDSHEVQPFGALQRETVDVVIIAATSRDLDDEEKAGHIHRDLRAHFPVQLLVPELADRPEDLFATLEDLYTRTHGPLDLKRVRVDVEAIELLMHHDWPDSIAVLDRLVQAINPQVGLKLAVAQKLGTLKPRRLTRELIEAALAKHKGNQIKAMAELGVSRGRFLYWMRKYEIGGGSAG